MGKYKKALVSACFGKGVLREIVMKQKPNASVRLHNNGIFFS